MKWLQKWRTCRWYIDELWLLEKEQFVVDLRHKTGQSLCLLWALSEVARSVQEKVPDARCLDPGDVGRSAGENAGLVLHSAADGAEAHHAVHLPAVPPQLAQQRTTGVALKQRRRC